jgi:multidrug efflux pump subunit AcrB
VLPSEIMNAVSAKLSALEEDLPDGFVVTVSGAEANRQHSFGELSTIMAVSIAAIFIFLALQFNHAVKPLLVFAAVPYGMVGSLAALYVMGVPFGVMAFMGIISLVGVIVSHIIVLFDFIEANREQGKPLQECLLDAGIARLRPVMITVGATVLALVPLAYHGGPLWQPLCYAQIGGLMLATFIELLLVKVFYAIAVLDLRIVRWDEAQSAES